MKVSALLRAGHKVSEVANIVGVSVTAVYVIMKRMKDGEGVNRRAGSGRKTVVDHDSLENVVHSNSRTSMRQHARRLGIEATTVRRTVAKLGAMSRVNVENTLLMPAIRAKRIQRCQMFVNDLISATAGRVIIYSNEKI